MNKIFKWENQLDIGNKGESCFLKKYPNFSKIKEGYSKNDFICKNTGHIVELKSENYDSRKTNNIFVEVFSNFEKRTPGGVFRSNDADTLIHYFIKDNKAFIYDVQRFIETIRVLDLSGKGIETLMKIPNDSYYTAGKPINRDFVKTALIEVVYW
jgi:hypothetical protein